MKVLIDNYRGFDIQFDVESERFQCVITEDITKDTSSYAPVKKFIDDYKKDNKSFAPFYAVSNPDSYTKQKRIKIVGMRKDRRFISEVDGETKQVSDYSLRDFILELPENEVHIAELYALEERQKQAEEEYRKHRKEIVSRMKIVTLGQFKQQLDS